MWQCMAGDVWTWVWTWGKGNGRCMYVDGVQIKSRDVVRFE